MQFEGDNRISAAKPVEQIQMEGEYSNGEDAEVEDVGEDVEVEATARNEEARKNPRSLFSSSHNYVGSLRSRRRLTVTELKTKLAMESLNAIEKCFATLRDKFASLP